jgi:hypothetical protein
MKYLLFLASLCLLVGCGPQAKSYPFDTCLISGKKLGDHGDPVVFVKDGQQVKLCCESCREDFEKDAPAFMAKIAAGTK